MTNTDMNGMCSCDINDGDYDPAAFYHKELRIARKEHRCYECNKKIKPGEKYEIVKTYFDRWDTFKTHLSCAGIRRDFCCNMHGAVDNTFEELYGFSPWELPEDDDEQTIKL